ncbi:MAG: diguanylate cyclase [Magnetococcales bacterium]|nr:diguanylate cyclase [Magnetococcales bacterium]
MWVAKKVDDPLTRPFSIHKAIFLPLLIGLSLFISLLLVANWWLDRRLNHFMISQDVLDVGKDINFLLEKEHLIFKNYLTLLSKDENLYKLFIDQDRPALLAKSEEILNAFREQRITHLYFHRSNSTNFLRVHNPALYDDVIDRPLLAQAKSTLNYAFGTEIGRVGTLTMRGVLPWFHEGKLLGFLEIGKEFTHLVYEISQQNNLEMYSMVEKKYFDRSSTQTSLELLGISSDWDHYGPLMLLGSHATAMPVGLQEYVASQTWMKEKLEETIHVIRGKDTQYFFSVPVRNSAGEAVARIMVHRHYAQIDQLISLHHLVMTGVLVFLAILLGTLLYRKLEEVAADFSAAANKLQTSERRLAKAQEIAQLGNWQWTVESGLLTCSQAIRPLVGNDMGEEGMPLEHFTRQILPEDRPLFDRALENLLHTVDNHFDLELRLLHEEGTRTIHMRGRKVCEIAGEPTHIVGTMQDISARRQLEESILKNEFFLRNTVESIHDGLLVIDTNGQIVVANAPFVSLWQLPADWLSWSLEEKLLPTMIGTLKNADHLIAAVLRGFETASIHTLRFHDGRVFTWYTFPLKCDGSLCGCIWRFSDSTESYLAEKREERAMQSRIAISALLETGMEPLSLTYQLEVALEIILTVPWLAIQRRGTIFLADMNRQELILQAHRGISPGVLTTCQRVAVGQCLCGQAAESRQILFKRQLDDDHAIHYPDIQPHGHYCVPILSATHLKGVLNLYLLDNHHPNPEEEAFLTTVANVLAGLIELRETEQRLSQEKEFTATVLRTAPALVTVSDPEGRLVLFNRACQELTGMQELDVLGRRLWEFPVVPEQQEELQNFFANLHPSSQETRTLEHSWMCLPSEQCLIEWHMATTLNQDGSVRHVIGAGLDITHRKETEQLLKHMAGHDPLTGLANRRLLSEHLTKAIAYAERDGRLLAVLYLDLDHFKEVNDQLGHDAGDWVLQEAIRRIQQQTRRSDTMARLGGDEFILVAANLENDQDPAIVAGKIIEELSHPFVYQGQACHIGVSIGISLFPRHGKECELLLVRADQAMYQAKQQGRNRYIFFQEN